MSLSIPSVSNFSAVATNQAVSFAENAAKPIDGTTDAGNADATVSATAMRPAVENRDFGIGNLIGRGGMERFPVVLPPRCLPPIVPSPISRFVDQLFQLIQSLIAVIGSMAGKQLPGATATPGNKNPGTTVVNPPKIPTVTPTPSTHGPKNSIKVDGPDGFLFKPISDSDKKLAVLLPHKNTGNVASVVLKDAEGKIVGRGKNTPAPPEGREIFRFPKAGGSYPPNLTVEVTMKDGSTKEYKIGDPSKRYD